MQLMQDKDGAESGRWVVTKAEFAKMRGISASRISQLIADKRLHGGALVGEGVRARIDVVTASEQLGMALDPLQQIAQGRFSAPGGGALGAAGNDNQRILQAKAEQAEIATRAARREEMERLGIYCRTEEVKRIWSRQMAEILAGVESWLSELAAAYAREMRVDQKQALILARQEWRAFRARRADIAAAVAAAEPDVIEDSEAGDA